MAQVAGITFEPIGKNNYNLVINYKKHPELVERIIEETGATNTASPYNKKFVEKIVSQEKEPSVAIKTEDLWK